MGFTDSPPGSSKDDSSPPVCLLHPPVSWLPQLAGACPDETRRPDRSIPKPAYFGQGVGSECAVRYVCIPPPSFCGRLQSCCPSLCQPMCSCHKEGAIDCSMPRVRMGKRKRVRNSPKGVTVEASTLSHLAQLTLAAACQACVAVVLRAAACYL